MSSKKGSDKSTVKRVAVLIVAVLIIRCSFKTASFFIFGTVSIATYFANLLHYNNIRQVMQDLREVCSADNLY